LTVGVHPPWVFADRQIPAVDIARITQSEQLTGKMTQLPTNQLNNKQYDVQQS